MEISFSLPVRPIKWLTVREADGGLGVVFQTDPLPRKILLLPQRELYEKGKRGQDEQQLNVFS